MTGTRMLTGALDTLEARSRTTREHDLAARAGDADLVDVAYRILDSPVGPLLAAATPAGLVRLAFAREGHDGVLAELAATLGPRVLRAPAPLEAAARELDEYFARRRTHFELPLDLTLVHGGFRRSVVEHLTRIPYGATESYGQVAATLRRPRAARAVGTACARNPLPIVAACHRVVRGDGSTGHYSGGADIKRLLLDLEAGA